MLPTTMDGLARRTPKFHFWTARPNHFDPTITTVVPNPNFPTYVSNAATLGMATNNGAEYLFPREATRYRGLGARVRVFAALGRNSFSQ